MLDLPTWVDPWNSYLNKTQNVLDDKLVPDPNVAIARSGKIIEELKFYLLLIEEMDAESDDDKYVKWKLSDIIHSA